MPKETPRKRKSLTSAQKKEICLKKISTPFLKQKDLAKEYDVSEGMFPIIEEALTIWIDKALQAGLVLTESILATKALDFALLCNEEKFKASNGWLDNFKKRHNLKQYNIHGEGGNAPIQDLDSMREKLR
ncbi:tigger transposable element-derived protein 6-like [Rhizophagus irregularis DAOM 181602=DAOM 197198]|uniref:HTH CENPB-type domain-containing protein n=1 Tax=Rhizophagus irregularis (strain DAOM 197198w) TaxID=1432141 RepID=A0A015JMW3_RHIIW|nr:hypothetical protein RirG_217930 [Rhizophagus irregularis DAOM 197198w]GET63700.1 tigger transposable element-derived protein 6-like [Rhizophagus irregularis DAOM 181602=DAOM 197198]